MSTHSEKEFREDIQILRGVAVLMVLLFHIDVSYARNGFLGVDIFFVISGFLMAKLYDRGSARDFFYRRAKRLLPAYFALIGIVLFVSSLVTLPVDFNQVLDQSIYAMFMISNIGFWSQNSYFSSSEFNPLLNLWSLGVELQYYLIVPLLLPLLHRRPVLLILLLVLSLVVAFVVVMISPKTSFFWLPTRLWEFLVGAWAAWYLNRTDSEAYGISISVLLVVALSSILLLPMDQNALSFVYGHPGLSALLACSITGLILIRPLHATFSSRNLLGRGFVLLGKYSYSIYLVHFPIIVLFNYEPFEGTRLGFNSLPILLLIALMTLVMTWLFFNKIEKLRDGERQASKFVAFFIGSLFLGLVSIPLNQSRFSAEASEIFAAWTDRAPYRCGKLFRILEPTSHICRIGIQSGASNVLLIGNSHADAIKTAVSETLQESDSNTLFYVVNDPLMGGVVTPELVLKDVQENAVSIVLFHYSPNFYDKPSQVASLKGVIHRLIDNGTVVYLLSPVPAYDFHVPKMLYEAYSSDTMENPGLTRQQYFEKNAIFFDLVKSLNSVNFTVLNTQDLLCSTGRCLLKVGGKPLYFDSGHLTLTGADLLKPLFEKIGIITKIKS